MRGWRFFVTNRTRNYYVFTLIGLLFFFTGGGLADLLLHLQLAWKDVTLTTAVLLYIAFYRLDLERFMRLLKNKTFRLLPYSVGTLYGLNLGLALLNGLCYLGLSFSLLKLLLVLVSSEVSFAELFKVDWAAGVKLLIISAVIYLFLLFVLLLCTVVLDFLPLKKGRVWVFTSLFLILALLFVLISRQLGLFVEGLATSPAIQSSLLIGYLLLAGALSILAAIRLTDRYLEGGS